MNHFISLQQAIEMTTLYRTSRESILSTNFKNQNILPFSETFDRSAFEALMAQPGCTAIRLYYGMDEGLKVHAIYVGVDANNQDILPAAGQSQTQAITTDPDPGEIIIEAGKRCPEDCPPPSPLNP